MSSTTCPRCGKEASGNFCSSCGATLGGRHCTECGAEIPPGARFCTQCGAAIGADAVAEGAPGAGGAAGATSSGAASKSAPAKGPARGGAAPGGESTASTDYGQAGWWIAGAVLVVAIFTVAWPAVRPGAEDSPPLPPPTQGAVTTGQGPGAVDLGAMTPREAADRLFGRVMSAAESGDTATVATFLPMTLQAYDRARPLDADGIFHLALLQLTGDRPEEALATSEAFLEERPDHLLVLGVAARSAAQLGLEEKAAGYYGHMLEVWDDERARQLDEYLAHESMFPSLRQEAQEYVQE